ncbi:MAG: sugar phosphate isomerase/epimerase family protein [Planctomycetaceae bacterium]
MFPLKIAIATHVFPGPLRKSLRAAAKCGAKGVQIDVRDQFPLEDLGETARRELLHHLSELGLSLASLAFPLRRPLAEEQGLEVRLDALRRAMTLAFQLKAKTLTTRIGPIPADAQSTEFKLLVDVLNDLARHGNHVGAVLAIAPGRASAETLAKLAAQVTAGPFGFDYDPAAFIVAGHDPLAALRDLHRSVVHVRVRDAIQDVDGSGVEVPVGRGEVDWPETLALFAEMDYRGWLAVDRTGGDDAAGDVVRAAEFLQQVAFG